MIGEFEPSHQLADHLLVVGPIGAGKSVVAAKAAEMSGLPLINIDKIMLDENKVPKPKDRFITDAEELFSSPDLQDGWVADGTYRSIRHLTWDHADLIIYLRPTLLINSIMVAKRALTNDVSGGNSKSSLHAQMRRLYLTRAEDLEKIDRTVAEYAADGIRVETIRSVLRAGKVLSQIFEVPE